MLIVNKEEISAQCTLRAARQNSVRELVYMLAPATVGQVS
jgi:hypothetical protein